jgi:hypothetical protein
MPRAKGTKTEPKPQESNCMRYPSTAHPADSAILKAASNVKQELGKPPHALHTETAYAHPHA